MGFNFKNAAPSIYKSGLLNTAWKNYRMGNFKEARNKLKEGFKI